MRLREFVTAVGRVVGSWPLRAQRHPSGQNLCVALLALVALLVTPVVGEAQQPKQIPRLCFLTFDPGTLQSRSARFDAFFQGLHDLSYVDGQNITIDYLSADGVGDRF